jgi:branched-chain amino acid aminotransferase
MIALSPGKTDGELEQAVAETIAAYKAGPGAQDPSRELYVRMLLTRGVGDMSYNPASSPAPTLVIIVKPLVPPPASAYADGVRVALVSVVRNHPQSVSPLIKSNCLLNNALGMQEAMRQGAFEAILRNYLGEIVECSQSNFFVVKQGVVTTAPLDAGLLGGITRAFVLDIARDLGLPTTERPLFDGDLDTAEEAFLTSTSKEVVPIVAIDDRQVGDGRPGPIATRLLSEFRLRARRLALESGKA